LSLDGDREAAYKRDMQTVHALRKAAAFASLMFLGSLAISCGGSSSKPADKCAGVTCTASDKCHVAGTCDPGTGQCSAETAKSCTSGLACDLADGQCKDLCANVTCTPLDQCHTAGQCDPNTGHCSNPLAMPGTACNDGNGCTTGDTCGAAGVCAGTAVNCDTPPDAQCQGTLGSTCTSTGDTTYTCSYIDKVNGTSCNADSNGCTRNDSCQAGVCTAGAPVVCNTPTDPQCQSATGTCSSTGNDTFTCSYTPVANGTSCADGNGCTQNDTCQSGACSAGAAVTCSQSTNPCQAATGTCTSTGATTHSCSFANLGDGTSCNTAGPCTTGQTCTAGVCSGGSPFCLPGQTCNPAGPTCAATAVAPQVARDLPIAGPVGLAIDVSGNSYVAGAIYPSPAPIDFDGHPVSSGGDADIFLAKYDNAGHATWAVGYGDGAAANPQIATGAAVTSDGTLAVIGNFAGSVTIGANTINSASQIDFLAGFASATGAGVWAKQLNDGVNGQLKAIAANPNDASAAHGNRIAVCGFANSGAPTDLVGAGATNPGGNDIVIGVFKSDGTKLWARQIASTAVFNEDCSAIAVDDNGDVWAAGSFSGASLDFGGATSALTGPGAATRKYTWVAKLNGATGAAIFSAGFSGTAGVVTPAGLAVDASGNVVVAGQFTGNVTFGTTTVNTAGVADAWVAKLSPALAPVWAVRLGGAGGDVANGVAVDSFGDAVVTGTFNRTTSGAAVLTATTTTASNPFVLKLNGLTGATDSAAAYGCDATSSGDAVAVNRFGATPDQISLAGSFGSTLTFGAPGTASPVTSVNPTDVYFVAAKLQPIP
jgi:hypothetical protein